MREAGLARGGREGEGKEGGWPSERGAAPLSRAVAREGSPRDAAGGCVVEEASGGTPPPCIVAGGEGLLPARRKAPGYSPVPPAYSSPECPGVSRGTPLSVRFAFVSRSLQAPGSAGIGE